MGKSIRELLKEGQPVDLAIDVDGTLAEYYGWDKTKEHEIGDPLPGAVEFCNTLIAAGVRLIVFTGRDPATATEWLKEHGFPEEMVVYNEHGKPAAFAYLDERGLRFEGDFAKALTDVLDFRTWWEKNAKNEET